MSTATEVVSIAEAADVLGVKAETVYAYISRGQLQRKRLPGDRRSWLSRQRGQAFGSARAFGRYCTTRSRAGRGGITDVAADSRRPPALPGP